MLIGEVYRKLPKMIAPEGDSTADWSPLDIEDLATADAFGALRYLPRSRFLLPVLRGAKRASDGAALSPAVLDAVEKGAWELDLCFWPGYQAVKHFPEAFAWAFDRDLGEWNEVRSVEPDVVIEGRGPTAPALLVFVECKFRGSELGADPSQLARQYWVGRRLVEEARAGGRDLDF